MNPMPHGIPVVSLYNRAFSRVAPMLIAILLLSVLVVIEIPAHAELFVTNLLTGTVGEYTDSGVPVNPALISGLSRPVGIAVSGSSLFVANGIGGTVGEYTTAGVPVNPTLISGLTTPVGIAVSGSSLFVTELVGGTVSEYTTAGALVNPTLITGLDNPYGIAVASPVPVPAAAVLFPTGLGILAFAFRKRGTRGGDSV